MATNMVAMNAFFLTDLDPNAKLKGSRDPLGLQPVWTSLGRNVVGTLTTVTQSVRNFTTLLLGLYVADELIAAGKVADEDRTAAFLRFEQLAAYSRVAAQDANNDSGGPLGTRRVKKRLSEKRVVTISADVKDQILSNQKTYGIWGLYSSAGRNAGLVMQDAARLTPAAHAFVERHYVPKLKMREIFSLCERGGSFSPDGRNEQIKDCLAAVLRPKVRPEEFEFYMQHLVLGKAGLDGTQGRQEQLWTLLKMVNAEGFSWSTEFGYTELLAIIKKAKAEGFTSLAEHLLQIAHAEPLLSAIEWIFELVNGRDKQTTAAVTNDLHSAFPDGFPRLRVAEVEHLAPVFTATLPAGGADLVLEASRLLGSGELAGAIPLLIALNASVMNDRGGAPWLQIRQGIVCVDHKIEQSMNRDELALTAPWVNPYFINSLKRLGAAVNVGRS